MADNRKKDANRQPREAQSREHSSARKPWAPPSALDAPNPPEGYIHRWVRTEVRGYDDRKNMSARLREGWEPVRADEYPELKGRYPTIEDGQHAGVIGVGGLMLARIPEETVEERTEYFREQTRTQMDAVDQNLMREQDSSMPIHKPDRRSRVTFGGKD